MLNILYLQAEIYAGALIIQFTLGWDKYLSVLVLLACTALYTIVGGLASVIFTDALQTIVIVVGATILSVMSELYIISLLYRRDFMSHFLNPRLEL